MAFELNFWFTLAISFAIVNVPVVSMLETIMGITSSGNVFLECLWMTCHDRSTWLNIS